MVRLLMYSNEWDIEGIIVDRHPSSFANQTRARGRIRYGRISKTRTGPKPPFWFPTTRRASKSISI